MKSILALSTAAGELLCFYRGVSDPKSGKIMRQPTLADCDKFNLPFAKTECRARLLDRHAFLVAHRELKALGLIEVRPKPAIPEGSTQYGDVYIVLPTYH